MNEGHYPPRTLVQIPSIGLKLLAPKERKYKSSLLHPMSIVRSLHHCKRKPGQKPGQFKQGMYRGRRGQSSTRPWM